MWINSQNSIVYQLFLNSRQIEIYQKLLPKFFFIKIDVLRGKIFRYIQSNEYLLIHYARLIRISYKLIIYVTYVISLIRFAVLLLLQIKFGCSIFIIIFLVRKIAVVLINIEVQSMWQLGPHGLQSRPNPLGRGSNTYTLFVRDYIDKYLSWEKLKWKNNSIREWEAPWLLSRDQNEVLVHIFGMWYRHCCKNQTELASSTN